MARRAGKRNRRIIIQSPGDAQDATWGDEDPDWTEVATVWAQLEVLSAAERFQGEHVNAQVTARFTTDFREDVTSRMRVKDGSINYGIESAVDPDGGRADLVLSCARTGN